MTTPTSPARPLPVVDDLNRPYWEAAADGRLLVQRCPACERKQLPPVAACPACGERGLGWTAASGRGVVHTYTVLHRAYHPGFADAVPYNVSIIELEEGPLLLSNVVELPLDRLRIGLPVRVVFEPVGDGLALPKFAPDPERASTDPSTSE